jgi:hypothetical protein
MLRLAPAKILLQMSLNCHEIVSWGVDRFDNIAKLKADVAWTVEAMQAVIM